MTLEEYRNQQHEIDLVFFPWDFQNTERPRWTECHADDVCREGVDIFSKSVERQGASKQDVQGRRMLPWMATGAVPVRIRTATHFSSENSHRETSHRGRTFRSPWAFDGFFTNSQVISFYSQPSIRLLELSTLLPWMASPSSTIAPFAVLRISSSVCDRPLPS